MTTVLILFALFFLPVLIFSPAWVASIGTAIVFGIGALIGATIIVASFPGQAIGIGIIAAISLVIVIRKDRKTT